LSSGWTSDRNWALAMGCGIWELFPLKTSKKLSQLCTNARPITAYIYSDEELFAGVERVGYI
jgi:hypothetical protein